MGSSSVSPRRDRILAAAEREFASHGSAGARMERIASAAGVNKQLLFHYFKSKAGLHQAVVDAVGARLDLSASGGRTPAERLRELVSVLLLAAEEYQSLLPNEWRARAADRAAQIVKEGQRQGYFRDDVDPAAVSELIIAASLGWTSVAQRAGNGGNDARDYFSSLVSSVVSDYCAWR